MKRTFRLGFIFCLAVLVLGRSALLPGDRLEGIRFYTRAIEFDFISWTLDAFQVKLAEFALGTARYTPAGQGSEIVLEYLDLLGKIWQLESQINEIYADPAVVDAQAVSIQLRSELAALQERRKKLQPVAESVMQEQVSEAAAQAGLTLGGQPIPPVLYHTTPPPHGLIVSPRETIRQDFDISISPDLTIDQIQALEEQVDRAVNVSSLVVGIGGIGLYPTMVMETTSINLLAEVVAHEWIHNYLTLRPLGLNYLASPELRTMNETAASIAGKELGAWVIARYYPAYVPPPAPESVDVSPVQEPAPAVFDFNAEMRETRVTVDGLLAEGKIEAAEAYMEARRRYLWENGYRLRKINQAYFAFYGAYADQPGGAAGEDPVGAAVRMLRAASPNLRAFINRIAWLISFEQLQAETTGLLEAQPVP
jgi:hypothetical protein